MSSRQYVYSKAGIVKHRENPWAKELAHTMKRGRRTTGFAAARHSLVNQDTGEIQGDMAVVGTQKVVDKEEFVKFFSAGIVEVFELQKPGKDLFKYVLTAYLDGKNQPDQIYLNHPVMKEDYGYPRSKSTFVNGLNELLHKEFLAPVTNRENMFWVNPHLFYKGDRVRIIREYARAGTEAENEIAREQQQLDQLDLLGDQQ